MHIRSELLFQHKAGKQSGSRIRIFSMISEKRLESSRRMIIVGLGALFSARIWLDDGNGTHLIRNFVMDDEKAGLPMV